MESKGFRAFSGFAADFAVQWKQILENGGKSYDRSGSGPHLGW